MLFQFVKLLIKVNRAVVETTQVNLTPLPGPIFALFFSQVVQVHRVLVNAVLQKFARVFGNFLIFLALFRGTSDYLECAIFHTLSKVGDDSLYPLFLWSIHPSPILIKLHHMFWSFLCSFFAAPW